MRRVWPFLIVGFVVLFVLAMPLIIWGPGYLRHREETRIRQTGAPAMARVLRLEDSGNRFNDTPEIIVHLEVTAEGRPPWPARLHRIMTVADVGAFTPGARFAVRYDRERPERVAVAP
jgi:hypothetical protein